MVNNEAANSSFLYSIDDGLASVDHQSIMISKIEVEKCLFTL